MSLISENKENKVMVFIDYMNVKNSVKAIESDLFALDLLKLTRLLVGQRDLMAAYVFDSKTYNEDQFKRLHDRLSYLGFRVITRDYDPLLNIQKEVDVAMACEMVVHALRDHYDVAIVVSGDRDFIPAIQQIQMAGKKVEVATFSNSGSKEVMKCADKNFDLDRLPIMSMFNAENNDPKQEETISEGAE